MQWWLIILLMEGPNKPAVFITGENVQPVLEAYRELNRTIDEMDKKVEHVIKKHEAEFLYAYRNHIAKIKKELAEIKHKSEEQEKMFSSNDRIQYLEKEMVIFREEALKLYTKLDQKHQENELLKAKVKQLEKNQSILDFQEKEKIRTLKVEEIGRTTLELKTQELEDTLKAKDAEIARLNKKIEQGQIDQSKTFHQHKIGSLSTSRRASSLKEKPRKVEVYDTELKEWFLDCVRTVKREVAMRNTGNPVVDIGHIGSIDEFKTVDKLRLLELFLQNEKLLSWMYERMFPDRLSQMRYKLSNLNESQDLKEEVSISQIEKILLPKVSRSLKHELRSTGVVRNGKLNISQF